MDISSNYSDISDDEDTVENTRYKFLSTDLDIEERAQHAVPKNTRRRNKWVVNTFSDWTIWRNNKRLKEEKILTMLDVMDDAQLSFWLIRFVRVTTATKLYEKGIPEQHIMERTGHRSVQGCRNYRRTSKGQKIEVSAVINISPASATATDCSIDVSEKTDTAAPSDIRCTSDVPPSMPGGIVLA
ncbi:uncharacterized protein LOC124282918 [Haliotis rubra]|uniref:uncharacterized protein LOC124282918 n=1 Tax=Haliotis rubra TaxID=36100 RepID=UPI001EE559BA|nr:uncharacterized protein LOC124282918 [Haliotis rubra]